MLSKTKPTSLYDYAQASKKQAEVKAPDKPTDYNNVFKDVVNAVKENPQKANPVKDVLRTYFPQMPDKSSPMTTVYPFLNDKENYTATCVGVYNPKDKTTVVVEWEDKRVGPNKYDASKNREFKGFRCRIVVRKGNLFDVNPITGSKNDIRTALEPRKDSKILFDESAGELKEQ